VSKAPYIDDEEEEEGMFIKQTLKKIEKTTEGEDEKKTLQLKNKFLIFLGPQFCYFDMI